MSSSRGRGKPFNLGTNNEKSPKESNASGISTTTLDHLSQGVADVSLDSGQADGDWEVYAKKSRNKAGSNATKWGAQNFSPKSTEVAQTSGMRIGGGRGKASGKNWQPHFPDSRNMAGRGNTRTQSRVSESNYVGPPAVIRPPLEHGWNWQSRSGSSQTKVLEDVQHKDELNSNLYQSDENEDNDNIDDNDEDSDDLEDSDDDVLSEDFDSDASQKSYETRKKSSWFKKFFEILDSLTVEEINEPARQWHCPACQRGPGAIDWYRGLQPLMAHAKTKGSKRVKLHRELAELLDEELRRKGASIISAGELFGKWKGLRDEEKDHEIVWPPMVIIMNTKLEQDENDSWIGMGNQELLEYFNSYAASKARHSYGPQGHRGMSVLIFEPSARGYLEAERLHKHFIDQGTDRDAWDRGKSLLNRGGKRQLYGFMALKEDLDFFNQHMQGKSKMKFEMKSYQEMVVNQIKQMSEDNQQLIWLKNSVVKERNKAKVYEESLGIVRDKLRKTMEENRIVRQRTLMQHEENKEEMQLQEQFFKEQIKLLHETRDKKEENFERLQQDEREKVKQTNASHSSTDEYRSRAEEEDVAKFIKFQDKEMEDFVAEREELIKVHEDKMAEMKRRHWKEEVELEKEFNAELTQLMEKYSPHGSKDLEAQSN